MRFMLSDDFQMFEAAGYNVYKSSRWRQIYEERYVEHHGDLIISVDQLALPVSVDPTSFKINWTNVSSVSISDSPSSMANWVILPTLSIDTRAHGPVFNLSRTIDFNPSDQSSLFESLRLNKDGWLIQESDHSLHVDRAASRKTDRESKVQLAIPFMSIVLVCNLVKVIVMFLILLNDHEHHLVTNGDALASFLENPDHTTVGYCVASEEDIKRSIALWLDGRRGSSVPVESFAWSPHKRRFWLATEPGIEASSDPWSRMFRVTVFVRIEFYTIWSELTVVPRMITFLYAVMAALIFAVINTAKGTMIESWGTASTSSFNLGQQSFDARGILISTLVANAPQVLLSCVYFLLNTTMTAHSSAQEWNTFGEQRQPLRVTSPTGLQRSTHFLQLPYRRAVPLIIYSCLLHWLLSQSIFVTRYEVYDRDGALLPKDSVCACGYSTSSLLTTVVALITGIVGICHVIFRTTVEKIPYRANSSLILSAACHPPPGDVDAHKKLLKWGVTRKRLGQNSIGHCSLTSKEVTDPVHDTTYA